MGAERHAEGDRRDAPRGGRDALADLDTPHRFAERGQDVPAPDQQTPEALMRLQKADIDKWWPIIKAANIRAE